MLYGANGFTGRLTAALAASRGEKPVLAGRSADRVAAIARSTGLDHVVFDLGDPAAVTGALKDIDAVVHMAGPFSATSRPMVDACLKTRTHYLDITGEISVFEDVLGRDSEAKEAGVVLMPGAGFDVVPTDCMAAMLSDRLPGATHLELAIWGLGEASVGTTKTAIENLHKGGRARIEGALRAVPMGWKRREFPFARGSREAVSVPWGDVCTAWYTTGIPNITVYMALPRSMTRWFGVMQTMRFALRPRFVQNMMKRRAERTVKGPSERHRATGWSEIWGEVRHPDGRRVTGTLTTPEGYTHTADAALRIVQRVCAGDVEPGAVTPAGALGSDFVATCDGVTIHEFHEFDERVDER
jgi:saccharopine dehydrogenase (NAD+, L-lysine-forming)